MKTNVWNQISVAVGGSVSHPSVKAFVDGQVAPVTLTILRHDQVEKLATTFKNAAMPTSSASESRNNDHEQCTGKEKYVSL